jgi:hypothetical protein
MTGSAAEAREEEVLEAARAIRPFLRQLVGAGAAPTIDSFLADRLGAAEAGEQVSDEILGRLREAPATRRWWLDFLATGLPPEVIRDDDPTRSASIPGRGEIVPPPRYECSHGDYVWYRIGVAEPVPMCPTHDERLRAAPRDG